MDDDRFWDLIEESRNGTSGCEEQTAKLTRLLSALPPLAIVEFDQAMEERWIEAYRWDLWAVAYILNGGCSDDGFEYFRGWLIGQGRDFFHAVLEAPERAADRVAPGEEPVECEEIAYAAALAYERVTGEGMPIIRRSDLIEPAGASWEEEDLPGLYPDLTRRYSGG